jgi:hypothetical protein
MSAVTYLDPNQFESKIFDAGEIERQLKEGEIFCLLAVSIPPADTPITGSQVKILHHETDVIHPLDDDRAQIGNPLFAFVAMGGSCGCDYSFNPPRRKKWFGNVCKTTSTPC